MQDSWVTEFDKNGLSPIKRVLINNSCYAERNKSWFLSLKGTYSIAGGCKPPVIVHHGLPTLKVSHCNYNATLSASVHYDDANRRSRDLRLSKVSALRTKNMNKDCPA